MQPQAAMAVAYVCKSSTRWVCTSSTKELSALRDQGSMRSRAVACNTQGVARGTQAVARHGQSDRMLTCHLEGTVGG
jgi:hypothetical protein